MSNIVKSIYNGQCPYLNRTNSISIDYLEVPMCGTTQLRYRKGTYYCNQDSNCSFKDKYGRCPVYLSAPENPQ